MKKIFHILTLISSICISSCSTDLYDYDELNDRMDAFDKRLAELEDWCKETNTNINSLKALVESLLQHDVITSVTPVMNENVVQGYTITFLNADPVTIYHGQDGKDGQDGANGEDGEDGADGEDGLNGYTPLIGIKQDTDGIYYWTLDGEWMTDAQGQKFKAQGEKGEDGTDGTDGSDGEDGTNGADGKDGISPQLMIEENYWYISYDNGNTWQQLGKAIGADGKDGADGEPGKDGKDGESYFQSIDTSNADYVLFTFSDKTTLKIPTWAAFVALQTQCNQMNTNITALQDIVTALQNNDYVTGIVPVTENGKEIGYTITFSKSGFITIYHGQDGKDGTNGTNGTNGSNGQDGADGHTPIIGVKLDSDVYYWTIDGEWLLDEAGNKIKAQGEKGADGSNGSAGSNGTNGVDGKDGITPQLKIEDGYWYVSYDNGSSWKQLGKAVGEDGEDGEDGKPGADGQPGTPGANGKDGDSFFQSVDVTDTAVTFTLANGTSFILPLGNPSVVSKITDVTYIPRYDDGKATAYYQEADNFNKDNAFVELDFTISPKSILSQLTQEMLSIKAVYTESRATITPVELGITSFEKDATTGNIALKVSCAKLSDEFFSEAVTASITLCIADATNEIYSAYIPLLAPEKKYRHVIYYTSSDGNIVEPSYLESASDVKILSNTYEDGKGTIVVDRQIAIIDGFNNEVKLKSIEIPEGVIGVGEGAFSGCSSLENIVLPETIENIGAIAFSSCSSLLKIEIPVKVKRIEDRTFGQCSSLSEVVLHEGLEAIGVSSFFNCESLVEIDLPASVKTVNEGAFYSCSSLQTVDLKEGLMEIGDRAFGSCPLLSNIEIPETVVSIGEYAFFLCSSIKEIHIPKGVDRIKAYTFDGCESLSKIEIAEGVTAIETYAFSLCNSLKSITIPSTVKSIGDYALYAARNLQEVVCKPTTPPTKGGAIITSSATIKVPTKSLSIYKVQWSDFESKIVDGGF